MATKQMTGVMQHLRGFVLAEARADLTDGELLESFVRERKEGALGALVHRHGPMVWGVCRRILDHVDDAEDAFQATFLVLLRKAKSIQPREMVANWLYGVAHQTALKARATAAKRKGRERQVANMPEPAAAETAVWDDLQALLDQELSRLPDKYRVVLLLCDVESRTRKEAARQLALPEGTVASRLMRARTRLAKRLVQRGIVLSAGALAALLSEKAASAGAPAAVVSATIEAAGLLAAGQAATGVISVKVATLTEGVLKMMLLNKLKAIPFVVLLIGLLGLGTADLLHRSSAQEKSRRPITILGVAPHPVKVGEKATNDNELILGEWQAVRVENGGQVVKDKDILGLKLAFDKERVMVKFPGQDKRRVRVEFDDLGEKQTRLFEFVTGKEIPLVSYRLDPGKSPKWIDFTKDGKTVKGIYELKGDFLRIVTDESGTRGRPTDFVSQAGTPNNLHMVLKRVSPWRPIPARPAPKAARLVPARPAPKAVRSGDPAALPDSTPGPDSGPIVPEKARRAFPGQPPPTAGPAPGPIHRAKEKRPTEPAPDPGDGGGVFPPANVGPGIPGKRAPAPPAPIATGYEGAKDLKQAIDILKKRLRNEHVALISEAKVRSAIRTAIQSYEARLKARMKDNDHKAAALQTNKYFRDVIKPVYVQIAEEGKWFPNCAFSAFTRLEEVLPDGTHLSFDGLGLRVEVHTPGYRLDHKLEEQEEPRVVPRVAAEHVDGFGLRILDVWYGRFK